MNWVTDYGANETSINAVYGEYAKAGKGYIMVPLIFVLSVCMVR